MADPSNVDAAIMSKLTGDTGAGGLMTIMTDGAYFEYAPTGLSKFVLVSLEMHDDEYEFGGSAYEKSVYVIQAVDLNTSVARVKVAAARIHTLMQDVPLSISGYVHMLTSREARIRYPDPDPANPGVVFQHQGGKYAVFVSQT